MTKGEKVTLFLIILLNDAYIFQALNYISDPNDTSLTIRRVLFFILMATGVIFVTLPWKRS